MNKIIPALSVVVLCSCSTTRINTPDAPLKTSVAPESAETAAPAIQTAATRHHLVANRQFRHHSVIQVSKKKEEDVKPANPESIIPRIARYIKQGIASWYGPRFHGKKTATGEIFDMYALTAAHKTLPIPSYAEVTNLENNRSIIVRINDRGPYVGNRLLDLSYAAAKKLDIAKDGLAKVEVKALTDDQALRNTEETEEKNIYLFIGTFNSPKTVQKLQDKIAAHHLPEPKILPSTRNKSTRYKVQIGPFKSQSGAEKLNQQLAKLGITATQFITETEQSPDSMIQ